MTGVNIVESQIQHIDNDDATDAITIDSNQLDDIKTNVYGKQIKQEMLDSSESQFRLEGEGRNRKTVEESKWND